VPESLLSISLPVTINHRPIIHVRVRQSIPSVNSGPERSWRAIASQVMQANPSRTCKVHLHHHASLIFDGRSATFPKVKHYSKTKNAAGEPESGSQLCYIQRMKRPRNINRYPFACLIVWSFLIVQCSAHSLYWKVAKLLLGVDTCLSCTRRRQRELSANICAGAMCLHDDTPLPS